MDFTRNSTIQATCERGLAPWLAEEMTALGFKVKRQHKTGVETSGTLTDCMRLNLYSRIAYSIQFLLEEFTCRNADDLYRQASKVEWEKIIPCDGYFSVVSKVNNDSIRDTRFPNLRLKDAIVDRISKVHGRRPNSGSDREKIVIHLNWHNDKAWLFLNTSARKLSDRGYRKMPHSAPLRESLAAAILDACGYKGNRPLVNPMCGSGTLAIEAALLARNSAPGTLRDNFAFKYYIGFPQDTYQAMRNEMREQRRNPPYPKIIATDHAPEAIEAARHNAVTAGVDGMIEFGVCDFADTQLPQDNGIILMNPEYGQRLGEVSELAKDYKRIGDWFKQKCAGWEGYVFTGNLDLGKKVGLRPSAKTDFFNAKIECRLYKYEIYR